MGPSEVRRCPHVVFLLPVVFYPNDDGDCMLTLDIVGSHLLSVERGLEAKVFKARLDFHWKAISLSCVAMLEPKDKAPGIR